MNLNVPKYLDSKMIGMTYGIMRINEVSTMTTRQNDLVVKNRVQKARQALFGTMVKLQCSV